MDSPRIALRFRDFDPTVDTVAAHNDILRSQSSVFWGWWKKTWEDLKQKELEETFSQGEVQICIINRNAKRQFRTASNRIIFSSRDINLDQVPEYYRADHEKVAAWFQFIKPIEIDEYDEALAAEFEDSTILLLPSAKEAVPSMLRRDRSDLVFYQRPLTRLKVRRARNADKVSPSILHISDLHFGHDHNFRFNGANGGMHGAKVDLVTAISEDLNRQRLIENIGVIVISGDITSTASWDHELMDAAADAIRTLAGNLNVPKERILIAPGNHDFVRQPKSVQIDLGKPIVTDAIRYDHEDKFRLFRNIVVDTKVNAPLNNNHHFNVGRFSLNLGVLNSSNLTAVQFPEYGYVGEGVEDVLKGMRAVNGPSVKALILHHHLLPIRRIDLEGESVSVTLDASNILEQAQKEGVRLILHGHQHIPKLVKTSRTYKKNNRWEGLENEDVFVFANGSAGSNRLEQGQTNVYSVLQFSSERTELICRSINPQNEELGDYLHLSLPIRAH